MSDVPAVANGAPAGTPDRRLLESPGFVAAMVLLGGVLFLYRQWPFALGALGLDLPDADDAMRLVGVRDLLAGQSWFDTHQYRYGPPDGTPMHWSRLLDAPLALAIAGLSRLIGTRLAEGVVATLWPVVLFAGYCAVAGIAARRLAGAFAAGFAVLTACQMLMLGDIFGAGRIDHHNMQSLLLLSAAVGFGIGGGARAHLLAGALVGLSLAIGLEALPFVAALGMLYVGRWILEGPAAAVPMRDFALGLAATALLAFGLQTAPALWLMPACDALAPPALLLACGAAAVAVALASTGARLPGLRHRLAAAALGGAALVAVVALAYPQCLAGPYAIVPEPFRTLWISDIPEAYPFFRLLRDNPQGALQMGAPVLVAALLALGGGLRAEGEARRLLVAMAALLWTGLAIALVQVRGLYVASSALPVVAGWAIAVGVARLGNGGWRQAAAVLATGALLMGTPWAAAARLITAAEPAAPREVGSLLDPRCLRQGAVARLAGLAPGTVLAPIHLGPHILLYTPHSIVSGGYHRAVSGIIAGLQTVEGSQADMQRVTEASRADYLVLCPDWLTERPDGSVPFAKQLADGAAVPWLEPVATDAGPLRVWRVLR